MHANFETKKRITLRIMLNTVNHDILWYSSETWFFLKESSFLMDAEYLSAPVYHFWK